MHERELYERGLVEFNDGRYFDCHDTLEELWMDMRGRPRRYLQGLIQAAVGLYHIYSGNLTGAYSQLTKSLEKLAEYPPSYLGVDVASLVDDLEILRGAIVTGLTAGEETIDPPSMLRISYNLDTESLAELE
jgi:predicted metal-dependent hydrolase